MTKLRIVTSEGLRDAEQIERDGDWAITQQGCDGLLMVTHVPTGFAVTRSNALRPDQRMELLYALARLPAADLQTLNISAIKRLAKQHGCT